MLNKLDLELFKILDSEIDKTLSFGCWYEYERHNMIKLTKYYNIVDIYDGLEDKPTKILWHYPTTNEVLRYCFKKGYIMSYDSDRKSLLLYNNINENIVVINIVKPIQYQNDLIKQELILFLIEVEKVSVEK